MRGRERLLVTVCVVMTSDGLMQKCWVTFVVPVQLHVLACMLRNEVWEVVAVVSVISSFR